ncbi:MAG: DUF1092 family protein [Okeania sp. SIO2D1]|nr:DUF1092 family protein [Okeania sp. SIO2D1]
MGNTIWELDFYSRPILDDNQKKLWEVLICETPSGINCSWESLFEYSQFCSNKTVNSLWLKEALEKAIAQAPETPRKIRFFRRQMNNMIVKAGEELGIPTVPSRRTYTLLQLLKQRVEDVYPQQPGFDPQAARVVSVQYPSQEATALPDALRGDRQDKWAFVSLEAADFAEMDEWEITFGESLPLLSMGVQPATKIPGVIIFSSRATPLAAWMSGLELAWVKFEEGNLAKLRLETGISDSWILAGFNDQQTVAEAKSFEHSKGEANNIHFLAIQSDPQSQSFAGFWLLQEF